MRSTIQPKTICTWAKGKDTCNGDSGSPLLHQRENELYLVGVVSWGPKTCAHDSAPGVNSDIRAHLQWINETMKKVNIELRSKIQPSNSYRQKLDQSQSMSQGI